MYSALYSATICAAKRAKEEKEVFDALCESVTMKEADALREKRKERLELESQRRHELAVANAGRTLNFWGN